MYFCPFCGTLLQLGKPDLFQLFCGTCSYVVPVTEPLTKTYQFIHLNKQPDAEDAFKGSSTGEVAQITSARCGSDGGECQGDKAYFVQLQMRSADEPPTTFFKCTTCGFQWRSD